MESLYGVFYCVLLPDAAVQSSLLKSVVTLVADGGKFPALEEKLRFFEVSSVQFSVVVSRCMRHVWKFVYLMAHKLHCFSYFFEYP